MDTKSHQLAKERKEVLKGIILTEISYMRDEIEKNIISCNPELYIGEEEIDDIFDEIFLT